MHWCCRLLQISLPLPPCPHNNQLYFFIDGEARRLQTESGTATKTTLQSTRKRRGALDTRWEKWVSIFYFGVITIFTIKLIHPDHAVADISSPRLNLAYPPLSQRWLQHNRTGTLTVRWEKRIFHFLRRYYNLQLTSIHGWHHGSFLIPQTGSEDTTFSLPMQTTIKSSFPEEEMR